MRPDIFTLSQIFIIDGENILTLSLFNKLNSHILAARNALKIKQLSSRNSDLLIFSTFILMTYHIIIQ